MSLLVAAVVPVLDEHEAIGELVAGLRAAGACCVLVVDGGSRDGTREVAALSGAIIVDEPRRGYGRACLTGAQRALAPGPDGHLHEVIAFLDGDGSCDPADLPALIAGLAEADIALGRRPGYLVEPGAMPWHARLGNLLVTSILAARSGRAVRDLPPYKALRRAVLERLDLDDETYGWTVQVVARALAEPSVRVRELPVAFRVRRGGVSKVSGSWTTSIRAGRAMVGMAVRGTQARPVVTLMAKAPGAGHAKTRLASELGETRTAELWSACLADVADSVRAASRAGSSRPIVMLASPDDIEPVDRIIGPGWTSLVQHRPGLSAALMEVFLAAFDRGADRAIAVAGDAPGLPPTQILAALGTLDHGTASAVIGPSGDGGYHLIGLRWRSTPRWWPARVRRRARARLARRLETAFGAVPMGGTSALEATKRSLVEAGWRVTMVAPWSDIDTLADLRVFVRDVHGDGRWAPRTAAWVAGHQAVISEPWSTHPREPQEERS